MAPGLRRTVDAVIDALSEDLRRKPHRYSQDKLAGHCYAVAEALFALLGGERSPWRPMYLCVDGESHWFLKNLISGEVLDPTSGQFDDEPCYAEAIPKGFLTGYANPSERGRELIRRARRNLRNLRN